MQPNYYQKIRYEFLEPTGIVPKTFKLDIDIHDEKKNREAMLSTGTLLNLKSIRSTADYDLREVMQWLGKTELEFRMTGEGMIFDVSISSNGEVTLVDLSKPLKDQDLKELYELMVEVSK